MQWIASRRGVPTASCFDKIVTPARGEPSKQADAYICELIAEQFDPEYGVMEDYQSAAMRMGLLLEPEARRWYEFERGIDVRTTGLCLTDDRRFGASPDALCGDDGSLELKCPNPSTHVRYLIEGKLPDQYKPQVHGQLIVTGRKWVDFMAYSPGFPPLLIRVEPDDYTEKVRKALDDFWPRYQEALEKVRAMDGFPEPAPVVEDDEPVLM